MTFSILSRFYTRPDIFQSPRKRRHPERSASQIYRMTHAALSFSTTDDFVAVSTKNILRSSISANLRPGLLSDVPALPKLFDTHRVSEDFSRSFTHY
jgi:hypothetical protein